MKIIFSIGGSILAPEEVDSDFTADCANFLKKISEDHEIAVVVGGGKPARDAIKVARDEGKTWAQCDYVGILKTRENAMALIKELGDVLWYVANLATELGVDVSEVAQINLDKLNSRMERGVQKGSGDNR